MYRIRRYIYLKEYPHLLLLLPTTKVSHATKTILNAILSYTFLSLDDIKFDHVTQFQNLTK